MTSANSSQVGKSAAFFAVLGLLMFGFGFALAPLYEVFCQVTGWGGGRQIVAEVAPTSSNSLGSRSNSTSSAVATTAMPVVMVTHLDQSAQQMKFFPAERRRDIQLGEVSEVIFVAENLTSRPRVVRAIPSISPVPAVTAIKKIECFCFREQPLAAGERKEFVMRFWVDPQMDAGVKEVVLGYTLYEVAATT